MAKSLTPALIAHPSQVEISSGQFGQNQNDGANIYLACAAAPNSYLLQSWCMKAAPSTQFNGPGPLSTFIVHIQDGHVVVVVVDPSSYGPGGIVHALEAVKEAQGLCSILWRLWILSSRPKTSTRG
ncbi:hypothetical protein H9L39_00633 [Fusarium oxysporum f. sp. albedinis]|nr:hypothetical protein H9L39_00633 [Fusarium oxysporum f. sp. albedinis]